MTVWCSMLFSTVFLLYCCSQCTYPCFPGVLLTSTLHNILFKSLAAFPHNYCRNNRQATERNESVAMTIIIPQKEYCWACDRTSNFPFSSPVCALPIPGKANEICKWIFNDNEILSAKWQWDFISQMTPGTWMKCNIIKELCVTTHTTMSRDSC